MAVALRPLGNPIKSAVLKERGNRGGSIDRDIARGPPRHRNPGEAELEQAPAQTAPMMAAVDHTKNKVRHVGKLGHFKAAKADEVPIFGQNEQRAGGLAQHLLQPGLFGRRKVIRHIAAKHPQYGLPVSGTVAAKTEHPPRVTKARRNREIADNRAMQWSRRALLAAGTIPLLGQARPKIKGYSLWPVRATSRTVWLIVQLHTDSGISGLGEASDAFGFASTSAAQAREMEQALASFAALVEGRSALAIAAYRRAAEPLTRAGGLLAATAYSAIEQALWDLAGQTLGVPTHTLFGGALRQRIPLYANINRATTDRSPAGFASSARQAVAEGYTALKAAPWDGYPRISARQGIDCTRAIREAVGPSVDVMVDVHSNFTVAEAVRVARELESLRLRWYEEPVAPTRVAETVEIARQIRQPIAGGEFLFGVDGFLPLCREKAAAVIMPDVKHCGGLLALTHIAAMAAAHQVAVAPHNPSGPVATVASLHAIAGLGNCEILELQWGEVSWRGELLDPPERITNGAMDIPPRPGFGISWNEKLARRYRL